MVFHLRSKLSWGIVSGTESPPTINSNAQSEDIGTPSRRGRRGATGGPSGVNGCTNTPNISPGHVWLSAIISSTTNTFHKNSNPRLSTMWKVIGTSSSRHLSTRRSYRITGGPNLVLLQHMLLPPTPTGVKTQTHGKTTDLTANESMTDTHHESMTDTHHESMIDTHRVSLTNTLHKSQIDTNRGLSAMATRIVTTTIMTTTTELASDKYIAITAESLTILP